MTEMTRGSDVTDKVLFAQQHGYQLPSEKVILELGSSARLGLSSTEATARLERFGPNEIETEQPVSRWHLLVHQFKDPLIYILLIAALLTMILQDYVDSVVIAVVVLLNAIIGYIQESKAQRAILALAHLNSPKAHVIRDGRETELPGKDVVPGDIVILSSGMRIPADMRIIHANDLEVNESALTGESLVVRKISAPIQIDNPVPGDQKNMLFAGTIVAQGRAKAVVVRTGRQTEIGRIATSVREIGLTRTPLQEKVERLGNIIGGVVILFSLLIAGIGLLYQLPPYDVFVTVIAMAVSAIPEGLPVVMTITLAIGVRRMANRNAVIRSLPAVETLGSTTVIGSDKTGTLTKNEMTVRQIWADGTMYRTTESGYSLAGTIQDGTESTPLLPQKSGLHYALLAGSLANESNAESLESGEPQGDPTELSLHVSAWKGGLRPADLRREMEELDLLPFEPDRQFMATMNLVNGKKVIFLKGAPEAILKRCSRMIQGDKLDELESRSILNVSTNMGEEGLRVLAMAFKEWDEEERLTPENLDGDFVFCGLQGMEDPIRPEATESIRICHKAGIRVMMITGDHMGTALAIGRKLGIRLNGISNALEGRDLDSMADHELAEAVDSTNIFARVSPLHKFRIVEQLKKRDHIVAVTGDGVNDAPALRSAHLGIAMGKSGTDVAREASDMVLSDDNFATITAAIEEGRIVFSNIRKVTFFLLSTAAGEMIVILLSILLGWPLPFVAVQILWINLVTNGLQDVALAFEPGEPGILHRKPRPVKEGIFTRRLVERLGGVGILLALGTVWMFWWTMRSTGGDLEMSRTAAMTQMVVFQFFHVMNCRSLDRSIFKIPLFSNKFLFISLLAALLAHLSILHMEPFQSIFRTVPLSWNQWLMIVLVGILVILGGEIDKIVNQWRLRSIG